MSTGTQKISIREKVCYSFGDVASCLFWQTFMMFLLFFYTDIFGITAAIAGTMFLVTRIWDSVFDVVMGVAADRTNTRWGKFRPYLLWFALPFGIIGVLTFTTPNFSFTGKVIYAFITYNLMLMVYSAINIPYSALMGVITSDTTQRTSLSSYRFVGAFIGGLIIQAATIPLVEYYGKDNQSVAVATVAGTTLNVKETGVGTSRIILTADDGKGGTMTDQFYVKVDRAGYNPPAVANPIPLTNLEKGFKAHKIELSGVFAGKDGASLTYTATSGDYSVVKAKIEGNELVLTEPGPAGFFSRVLKVIGLSPEEKGGGTAKVSVLADDGEGGSANNVFIVKVNVPGNNPPLVDTPPADEALAKDFKRHEIDLSRIFKDTDGDALTCSATSANRSVVLPGILPGNKLVLIEAGGGVAQLFSRPLKLIGLAPKEKGGGIAKVTVTADDRKGGTVSADFVVTIKSPVNDPPTVVSPIANVTLARGAGAYTVDFSHVFKDIDGDSLTFSAGVVNEAKGFQAGVGLYAILAAVLFFMTFGFTKERVRPPAGQKTSLGRDLKDLWQNKPWFILFFLGIFTLTFVCIRNGSIMYYFKYYVGNEGLASAFMVVGTIANIAGVMLTGWFGRKLGKRNTYMGGMAIASVMIVAFYFLRPQDIAMMFILQVLLSFVLGPTSPLVWAMYADAADYSEWRTGRRATGLVFSAASFAIKFGWTIGGALAGWLLAYFGFRANVEQAPNTLTGICLMMSFIPAFASALAAVFVMFYKLDEPTMEKISAELTARRATGEA